MDDIDKGIVQLVADNGIRKLVMGAAADKHYSSCRKSKQAKSKKAITVARDAHLSCQISFVCKGSLICTREASLEGNGFWAVPPSPVASPSNGVGQPSSSNANVAQPSPLRMRSSSDRPSRLTNPVQDFFFRSKSENYTSQTRGRPAAVSPSMEDTDKMPMQESPVSLEGSNNHWGGISPSPVGLAWSTSDEGTSSIHSVSLERDDPNTTSHSGSIERDDQSEGGSWVLHPVNESEEDSPFASPPNQLEEEVLDDDVYVRLQQAIEEADCYGREAYEESNRRRKAERDAVEAARKAKASENSYAKEMKLRKEIEDLLQQETQQLESIKIQRQEVFEELQRARDQQSTLEAKIANSNRILSEFKEKFRAAEEQLSTVQKERDELERERDEAVHQTEELRRRSEEAAASSSQDPTNYSEFEFTELEEATNGFDPAMKIGEGGYGCVYKGMLRHTAVAVKLLRPESSQGQCEFQQEVIVLSKVRHPNLVTLIGTCPGAGALIYEFLANGSLEDRLSCKDNTAPLSWQTRTRIAADICSALIFLHSNRPDGIVHGDLKPGNVLIDSNYVAKLGDFGICRLIPQKDTDTTLCLMTDPKGTPLYMDPEFRATGVLTPRSDVYSFGIIILRLLTGKPVLGIAKEVEDALKNGCLQRVLDETAGDWPFVQAKQLAHIGVRCCQLSRKNRPDLVSEVWRVLEPMTASAGYASCFRLMAEDSGRAPSYFICPIFLEIMRDPHIAADGFTYEAEAIRGWLDDGNNTSPMTNVRLPHTELIPNRALKSAIQEWLHQP
ncbi:U-box domain-containing protein 33 isoform X2 [Magnolia sinica]|nr:U-box domain-containing protein 33 isoform X2 [Magnolia sinica]